MHTGEKYLQKMQLEDDAPAVAKRLTTGIYRMLRGETAPTVSRFGRALDYPRPGAELREPSIPQPEHPKVQIFISESGTGQTITNRHF
jgi:hypothetical protein